MKDDCLFCKIARKEVASLCLYEDDDIMVILDAFPDTDGHTLVIPKKHYEDITSVPDHILLKMLNKGQELTPKIMERLDKTAATLLFNYGSSQAIKHIHLHLLPDFMHKTHNLSREEVYAILSKE
jgi:histidine triad (HIT) family protein